MIEPELGQIIDGKPWSNIDFPHDDYLSVLLYRLDWLLFKEKEPSVRLPRDTFKNGTFAVRPYSWAECNCFDDGLDRLCCDACLPNFEHFRSGLVVRWYKHPGRSMNANRDVSNDEMFNIFMDCVESIKDIKALYCGKHTKWNCNMHEPEWENEGSLGLKEYITALEDVAKIAARIENAHSGCDGGCFGPLESFHSHMSSDDRIALGFALMRLRKSDKSKIAMTFKEYQNKSKETAKYPSLKVLAQSPGQRETVTKYIYPAIGLSDESGEVLGKIKKIIRDNQGFVTGEQENEIAKEIGDCLWYISQLATELNLNLEDIAKQNLEKLASRKERNVINGSGDNR